MQQLQPISEFSQDELLSGRLTIKTGLWFWDDRDFISASSVLKTMLLKEYHDSIIGGHGGCQKTLSRLSAQFFWKHMASSIKAYVKACSVCQQAKYNTLPPAGLLQPLPVPTQTWQDIAMDFITGLPLSHGYFVILVVVDWLSKFAYFIPLPTYFSAPKVADSFIHIVVSVHGLPHSIISDRDKVFTSKF